MSLLLFCGTPHRRQDWFWRPGLFDGLPQPLANWFLGYGLVVCIGGGGSVAGGRGGWAVTADVSLAISVDMQFNSCGAMSGAG
jgi:hypothetical protein